MKKDITYITLPSDLIQWISQKVQTEYQDIKEAEEFVQGLKGLLHSQENALFFVFSEESDGNREYQSGELMINPKSRRVLCRGQEVNLTPKEFDILYFLFQNKGEVFTKEQIYQAVHAPFGDLTCSFATSLIQPTATRPVSVSIVCTA